MAQFGFENGLGDNDIYIMLKIGVLRISNIR